MSLSASKTLANTLTFQRRASGGVVYKKTSPGDRMPFVVSTSQHTQRNKFHAIVEWWQALTPTQKAQWDHDAYSSGFVGTGYHYFMKRYGGKNSPWANNFLFRKRITIDKTKVSGAQVNFPFLYSVIDADLASCMANGNDIIFTASDGITKLDHEIELFTVASGTLIAWVRIPSLSASVNTELYIYYEQPSASSQQNPTGVWDSNFLLVAHMNDLTTSTVKDSTTYNRTLTKRAANEPVEIDAKVGKGQDFDGSNDYIATANNPFTQAELAGGFTYESWTNFDVVTGAGYIMSLEEKAYLYRTGTLMQTYFSTAAGDKYVNSSGVLSSAGVPYRVALTWNTTTITNYVNGVVRGTPTASGICLVDSATKPLAFGIAASNLASEPLNGKQDEVRVSKIARSTGWLLTDTNTQSSPSTFFSVGGRE